MHKVFISYHHQNDQWYKEYLVNFGKRYSIFIDESVDTGGIPDDLPDERIREKIRDDYLRDSTVTIVLVGTETKRRKHVDWEIYSSMYDGPVNKKSGVLVLTLPLLPDSYSFAVAHAGEKKHVYPDVTEWTSANTRAEYERRYPSLPDRLIDNLLEPEAKISVTPWNRIENDAQKLKFLVDAAFEDRVHCDYDLSQPMRRQNS